MDLVGHLGSHGIRLALMVFIASTACSPARAPAIVSDAAVAGDTHPPGAADVREGRRLSFEPTPPQLLPMRTSPDPARPFQHNAEVSIAAHHGNVVVASISLHHDSPETVAASSLLRGVGVVVSHDDGETFGPALNPGFTDAETSDPVVRATADGTFWVAAIGIDPGRTLNRGVLLASRDGGHAFDLVHDDLRVADKEWLAPTATSELYLGADGGFWKFAKDGSIQQSWTDGPDWPIFGAYADERGAHFVLGGPVIATWAGDTSFARDALLQSAGDAAVEPFLVGWGSVPIGPLQGGGFWAVYNALNSTQIFDGDAIDTGDVRMQVFPPGAGRAEELVLSAPEATAFLPAAAVDAEGRLHVVWYESGADRGVLKYARSISADLRRGLSAAKVVDADACPAGRWVPGLAEGSKDRRLREYIDLAIDGGRVHIAWTHAAKLPARVYTSHVDF